MVIENYLCTSAIDTNDIDTRMMIAVLLLNIVTVKLDK